MGEVAELLGATRSEPGRWRLELAPELFGAFGGAFGGAVAAAGVLAARDVADGRAVAGVDCRFLRPVNTPVTVGAEVLRAGRNVTVVEIAMTDETGRACVRTLISFVDPSVLAPVDSGEATVPPAASGAPWRTAAGFAPIVEVLAPRVSGTEGGAIASTITLPWSEAGAGAEAVCMAADLSVGPPVGAALRGELLAFPNPDLSIRCCATAGVPGPSGELTGVARAARIAGGLAAVDLTVWSEGSVVAVGIATTLVLAGGAG